MAALDELLQDPQLDNPNRQYGDTLTSSQNAGGFTEPAPAPSYARVHSPVNRMRAADLADRGIPTYQTASGDVAPVTDESGTALNAYDARHGIAYDSKGQPKKISYGETGPPVISDPFASLPSRTDPKTGAIEKQGPGGLYQYQGQDPEITRALAIKEKDKAIQKESALVGRKLTLDEHDLTVGTKEQKTLKNDLTDAVPGLLDRKYNGADEATVMKGIDEHFNAQYAAPEANQTGGWFGKELSPEATALRQGIDQQKAAAVDKVKRIFELNDTLSGLHETISSARETERAQVETLLAHQRGETGPLDQTPEKQKAAVGLYPPVEDQARMLGGESLEPDKIMPGLGSSEPVKAPRTTPREQLDAPYAPGENSYRVGDDHSFHLDPNNMMKGLRQAIDDGIVDSDKAKSITPQLRQVQDAVNEQRRIIDQAGGYSKVKALTHGATLGAAFMAGFAPAAEAGAAGGAALGIPTGGISIAAAALVSGLVGGTLTSYAAKKTIDKLAESNDVIASFAASSDLHPYYDLAGNLISFGVGTPAKAATALAGLAEKSGSKIAQSIANSYVNSSGGLWRTVGNLAEDASIRKAGGASAVTVAKAIGARVGGAAAVNVVLDTVINEGAKAMGLQKEGETLPKAAMAAIIGGFVSGHGLSFITREPAEMANILIRAKGAMSAGKDINTVLSPAEAEAFDAFATELKRKINTGEIPVDTEAVTGIVRQAFAGGKNYGVAAADIIGKGGTKGLPEGPGAPKAPAPTPPEPTKPKPGGSNAKIVHDERKISQEPATEAGGNIPATKPAAAGTAAPSEPAGNAVDVGQVGGSELTKEPTKGGETPSGKKEKNAPEKGETTADAGVLARTLPEQGIAAAEKAFVEQGGHADKLDAQNALAKLREAFPEPAARIRAIQERLSISSTSSKGAKVDISDKTTPNGGVSVVPPEGGGPHPAQIKGAHVVSTAVKQNGQYLVGSTWNEPHAGVGIRHGIDEVKQSDRGFIVQDAKGKQIFATRAEAEPIAAAAGQIQGVVGEKGLQSEHLQSPRRSSTQVNLPAEAAKPIHSFIKSIPAADLYKGEEVPVAAGGARETEPHVTALYGITHDDAAAIAARVKGHGPVTLKLGKISKFSPPDKPYDVLKIDVESPDLHALNATLKKEPFESDFPKYKPHLTLAYVKKGAGDKYLGGTQFEGQSVTIPNLTFSARTGVKTSIALPAQKAPDGAVIVHEIDHTGELVQREREATPDLLKQYNRTVGGLKQLLDCLGK